MTNQRPRPVLYAHRGAAAKAPENTLPSFRRALEEGADALETDLHMTVDGHVIVSHDPSARRMTGVDARYSTATLAEIQRWDAGFGFLDPDGHRSYAGQGIAVPTLEQLLLEFPGVPLNVDIKQSSPPMVATVLALLERTRSVERVTVASFSASTILEVRRRGYRGATALSSKEMTSFVALPNAAWKALWRRLGGLGNAAQIPTHSGPIRLDTPARIDALHGLGLRVDYWTINDPAEARRLLQLGADGIMTDDPGTIKPVLDAFVATRTGGARPR